MVEVIINGKKEVYRDLDDMIFCLKYEHNIDLRNSGIMGEDKLDEVYDNVATALNELDQLGVEAEIEYLEELKEVIDNLRLNKDKKAQICEQIDFIIDGFSEHVDYYKNSAIYELENAKKMMKE